MYNVTISRGSAVAYLQAADWQSFADMVPILANNGFHISVSERDEYDLNLSALLAKDYTPICNNNAIWNNAPQQTTFDETWQGDKYIGK